MLSMRVADVRVVCVGLVIVGISLAAMCMSRRSGEDLYESVFR